MFKLPTLILALLSTGVLVAQKKVDVDQEYTRITLPTVSGNVLMANKYIRVVQGSPFFKEDYLLTNFVLGPSKAPAPIKINLLTGEVYYKNEREQELVAVGELKKIMLKDNVSNESYTFIHSSQLNTSEKPLVGWYQQLDTGKVSLYKFYKKDITETLPYGQATTEQTIHTAPMYFLYKDNTLVRLKKLKDLQALLADKSNEVAAFIKTNKLVEGGDAEFTSIVHMYNEAVR